ncbi:MAG TPA: cbb3-type cytochrome c oxidase N-terminal domain-containing protein [Sediminibacterium sp.]|nr:cbb3-type cytochrome c oxidase N-terminal domain-containing protein [Sediminibacterium sp.]
MKFFERQYRTRLLALALGLAALPYGAFAAGPPVPSEMSKPMAQVLMLIVCALALMIGLLANVVNGAAQLYIERWKELRRKTVNDHTGKIILAAGLLLVSGSLLAEDAATATAPATVNNFDGLSSVAFYAFISVILVELIILLTLLYNLRQLLKKELAATTVEEPVKSKPAFNWSAWWSRFNSFRPIQEESNIDLGHDYDGIRELDNRLPPWWLYGFYLCIVFAGVYLWRYHVAHSAPLSHEELQIAMNEAAIAKEEYLKKAANKVDETTVTYITDPAALEAGKKIFTTICAACHQADGGGMVGPNLTDKYWLHGGGIKDIFKSIKYGWPDKGMKSWKDDYSPMQIAQIASYVKSLGGTKPAKPKEPQGTLYEENNSTAPVADSVKKAAAVK